MNDVDTKLDAQTVNVKCEVLDIRHFQAAVMRRYRVMLFQYVAMGVFIAVVCGLCSQALVRLLLSLAGFDNEWVHYVLAFFTYVSLCVVVLGYLSGIAQKERFNKQGSFLSPQQITLTTNYLKITSSLMQYNILWRGILRFENTKEALLFFVDNMQAIYIPKRCFATQDDAEAFHHQAEQYWREAQAQPAAGTPA